MIGSKNIPDDWDDIKLEIHTLLKAKDKRYRKQVYITPIFYLDDLYANPHRYPLLRALSNTILLRYISFFLKEQGRITNSRRKCRRTSTWVDPRLAEIQTRKIKQMLRV